MKFEIIIDTEELDDLGGAKSTVKDIEELLRMTNLDYFVDIVSVKEVEL